MGKIASEFKFTGSTVALAGTSGYDYTKTNLGSLIKQYTGANYYDKFAGPAKIGMARPMEASTNIPGIYPHVISYDSNIDWVFLADNAAAAATRRIIWYEYNKSTSVFNWKGFITLTYPTATNHTIRGFRVSRDLYTTGTAAVSGTNVTGTSSLWTDDRLSVGSRIGFGSTDPTQITTWYQISTIGSNTSITLTATAGTISDGPYVIEDFRVITTTTNATATNGGLFVTKGLRIEDFTSGGTVIPAATTVDNIKAVYWLADASTVTNTTAAGAAIQTKTSWTDHRICVLNTTTPSGVFVYNMRAALTLTAGKDTTTNIIKTGTQAVTGTMSQTNNGRIATLSHGPGSGVQSLYFVTTTRIYRADISNITAASTTWQNDVMVEVPPGGTSTYAVTGALSSVEESSIIDRLIVTSTGAAGVRSYVTRYNTISDPMDHIFLADDKQLDQSTSDSGGVMHPSIQALPFSVWSEAGILYLARVTTAAASNQIYTLPIGAHWTYADNNNEVLITPAISTTNAIKFYKVYINHINYLGTDTFMLPTEPYRVYARTSGITDNTGGWTLLNNDGDLSSFGAANSIQFKFTFKIIGSFCIPARIMGLSVTYEDNTTDSHYEPSIANSNITSNIFAYRQSTLWNTNIPNMRIQLFNATTGASILDDNVTASAYGTFQYSTNNGSTWNTWSNSADNVGNYIRYTASSLPANVRIRALLTQS